MTNTVAATQVGETAELIELILSDLSPLDVIAATGVNKTFRNVILNSPMLQKKLFLLSTNALPRYWLPLKCFLSTTLFRTVTVDEGSSILEPTSESDMKYDNFPLRVVSASPLLKRPNEAQGIWNRYDPSLEKLEWDPGTTSPHQWHFLPSKEITGPWKQMYLTDPPCKSVSCTLLWEGWVHGVLEFTLEVTGHVYRQAGVILADLFDNTGGIPGQFSAVPRKGGGYVRSLFPTTLHKQIERCKKINAECEIRLGSRSTVALLWTVALTDHERKEMNGRKSWR